MKLGHEAMGLYLQRAVSFIVSDIAKIQEFHCSSNLYSPDLGGPTRPSVLSTAGPTPEDFLRLRSGSIPACRAAAGEPRQGRRLQSRSGHHTVHTSQETVTRQVRGGWTGGNCSYYCRSSQVNMFSLKSLALLLLVSSLAQAHSLEKRETTVSK